MTPDTLARVEALAEDYENAGKRMGGVRTALALAIRRASEQGHSTRTIARAAGISHQRVQQIVTYVGRSK